MRRLLLFGGIALGVVGLAVLWLGGGGEVGKRSGEPSARAGSGPGGAAAPAESPRPGEAPEVPGAAAPSARGLAAGAPEPAPGAAADLDTGPSARFSPGGDPDDPLTGTIGGADGDLVGIEDLPRDDAEAVIAVARSRIVDSNLPAGEKAEALRALEELLARLQQEAESESGEPDAEPAPAREPLLRTDQNDSEWDQALYANGDRNRMVVRRLIPGSVADGAGLQQGDQIVYYDGERIFTRAQLGELMGAGDGAPVMVDVMRDGRLVRLQAPAGYLGTPLDWVRAPPLD